jgi:plastocyanin
MRWPRAAFWTCLAVLGGCGGANEGPGRIVTTTAAEPIRVKASEYSFEPARIVVSGARGALRITLDNRGSLPHNIRVHAGHRDVGGLASFPAGQDRSTKVRLRPGRYRFVCSVADHEKLGMRGELEVRR